MFGTMCLIQRFQGENARQYEFFVRPDSIAVLPYHRLPQKFLLVHQFNPSKNLFSRITLLFWQICGLRTVSILTLKKISPENLWSISLLVCDMRCFN